MSLSLGLIPGQTSYINNSAFGLDRGHQAEVLLVDFSVPLPHCPLGRLHSVQPLPERAICILDSELRDYGPHWGTISILR